MAERDDDVARGYRAAAREEPPAALDAAILAASRRAVGARPGGVRRWAGPLSIAAVLVLGIGVTLRMQQERPGIESAMPASEYQMPEASPGVAEATAPAAKPQPAPQRSQEPEAPSAKVTKPAAEAISRRTDEVRAPSALGDAAPAAPPTLAAAAPVPRDLQAPAPAAPPAALGIQSAPAPQERAKREAGVSSNSVESRASGNAADPRVTELERIARLRAQGRDADADRALEEFRRVHRDYRIPEAMWERVRPR